MKKVIITLVMIMAMTIPSIVMAGGYNFGIVSGSYGTAVSVNVSGGSYHRHTNRTIVRGSGVSHYRSRSVYYGHRPQKINGYSHIHRQAGRRYVNDYPCTTVIIVPNGRRTVVYDY